MPPKVNLSKLKSSSIDKNGENTPTRKQITISKFFSPKSSAKVPQKSQDKRHDDLVVTKQPGDDVVTINVSAHVLPLLSPNTPAY